MWEFGYTAGLCWIELYFARKMMLSTYEPYSGVSHFLQQEFLRLFVIAVTACQMQEPGTTQA